MTTHYIWIETVPPAEDFCRLRTIAGLSPRPLAAAIKALPNSCYGVHVLADGIPVAMGRIVGDGALNLEIVDVAVDPEHQGKGLGRGLMEKMVTWLDNHVSKGAYVTLIADVPELYEKFDFKSVRPESEGMARVWK
jgi:GNAT superfamily N-acetyltransferase